MKHLLILSIFFSCFACDFDSYEQQSEDSIFQIDSTNKEINIIQELVLNQIENWQDSSILHVSLINGDRFASGSFDHDSIFTYGVDSIPHYYLVDEDSNGVYIEFQSERSALIDTPSISKFHIFKIENSSFYGTNENISPKIDWVDKDTFLMMPWERYLDRKMK